MDKYTVEREPVMPQEYRHRQIGWTILVFIVVFLTVSGILIWPSDGRILYLTVWFILMVVATLFNSISIVVTSEYIEWYFGPGFWKKRLLLKEIADVRVVSNKWYYGWGVRRYPDGWLYNVSGLQAVELDLVSGKHIRLGSDKPQQLADEINMLKAL